MTVIRVYVKFNNFLILLIISCHRWSTRNSHSTIMESVKGVDCRWSAKLTELALRAQGLK